VPNSKRKLSALGQNFHRATHFAIGLPYIPFKAESEYVSTYSKYPAQPNHNLMLNALPNTYNSNMQLPPELPTQAIERERETPHFQEMPKNESISRNIDHSIQPHHIKSLEPLNIVMKKEQNSTIDNNQMYNKLLTNKVESKKYGTSIYSMYSDKSKEIKSKQDLLLKDIKQIERIKELTIKLDKEREKELTTRLCHEQMEMSTKEEYQAKQYRRV
jgi:hypothetical protein